MEKDDLLLYRIGAYSAWMTAMLIPIAIISHLLWPPPAWAPGAAAEWFTYLQGNVIAGLLNLDFLLEIGLVLSIPLYLALYVALKKEARTVMLIATVVALLGIIMHIFSNTAWEMLLLSQAYSDAATDMERLMFLAAGEARLSAYYGMVFQVSYVLGYIAYILIGIAMLRSERFKLAARLGIITGIAGFGFYIPAIGTLSSVLVVLLVAAWNVMVGWRLYRMGSAS